MINDVSFSAQLAINAYIRDQLDECRKNPRDDMLTDLVQCGVIGPQASIGKLYWTSWHRELGETAMAVLGSDALVVGGKPGGDYELDPLHHTFMASRAETIYAGSSEIQRNIIGERVLGLPREPR